MKWGLREFKIKIFCMTWFLILVGAAHADLAEMMTTSQLMDESNSQKTLLENISVTESEMLMGPPVNNLGAETPAGATAGAGKLSSTSRGGGGGKGGGCDYSLRHSLSVGYALDPDTTIAPVLDLSQNLTGIQSKQLTLNDPQVKLTLKNIFEQSLWTESVRSNLLFSLYVPVSDLSRSMHSHGALSVSATPHLHFKESRFSLSGIASLKSGFYEGVNSELVSSKLFSGVQGNYQISHRMEVFLMSYTNVQIGTRVAMVDAGLPSETFDHDRASHPLALMSGLKIDASPMIAITPRLNWFLDQPIQTTTVGLNLMIRLI